MCGTPNYAFKPIAEQALRSNQTIVPQRLNSALGGISTMLKTPEGLPQLTTSDFKAQCAAYSATRKQMRGILIGIGTSVACVLVIHFVLPNGIPHNFIRAMLLSPLALLLVIYRLQWKILIKFQLHCPNCRAYLAASPRRLSSPTHHCPQCGKLALIPSKYLAGHDKAT